MCAFFLLLFDNHGHSYFVRARFRRMKVGSGKERVSLIIGRPKGMAKTRTQAIRYPKNLWTAERARKSCRQHGGEFHPAKR